MNSIYYKIRTKLPTLHFQRLAQQAKGVCVGGGGGFPFYIENPRR